MWFTLLRDGRHEKAQTLEGAPEPNELHFELQRRQKFESAERAIVSHPAIAIPDKDLRPENTTREARRQMLDITFTPARLSQTKVVREFEALRKTR